MSRGPRVPVLAYHAMHVSGSTYEANDHVAFAADVASLSRLGFRVRPLAEIVAALEADTLESLGHCVGLSFDDGSDFDYRDLPHPTWGSQASMLAILREAAARGDQPSLEATSFTIVSPAARAALDKYCMIGAGWWNDDWWAEAEASGLMRVENHSWDHNHEGLPEGASAARARRGTFDLASREECDAEVRGANEYLCERRRRPGPVLFAYPYGRATPALAQDYFPRGTAFHGVRAAFTTEAQPITRGASPWQLPRYVFGWHWKDPAGLEAILRACT